MMPVNLSSISAAGKLGPALGAALVLAVVLGLAVWRGYEWGHDVAATKGRAELAELDAAQGRANELAARRALRLIERQMDAGNKITAQLAEAKKTIAAQTREIKRRMNDAVRDVAVVDGRCVYGPGWVRWYNPALGVGDDADGLPDASGGSVATAGQAGAPGSGVRPGGAVSAEDLAAHLADYGRYCKELEAAHSGLAAWARSMTSLARNATAGGQ